MELQFNIGDTIGNYGKITRTSADSVWFGAKRFMKKSFANKKLDIKFKESPDAGIDWTNPEEVDKYYLTFDQWAGVVRMGDTKKREILEVKNNKVFHNGEYYLPYYSHHININESEKKFVEDSYVWGWCLKMHNSFYPNQNPNTVNVFYIESQISKEDYDYGITKQELFKKSLTIDYLKVLNLQRINSKDLDLLKNNFIQFFNKSTFPYTVNKVTFAFGSWNRIEVNHRNRSGYLKIDNGYHGSMPFGNDYDAILICEPYFTNEHGTYTRCERKEITWDKAMLDILSLRIVKAWDRAIENNYTLIG